MNREIKFRAWSGDDQKLKEVHYLDLLRGGFGIQYGQNSGSVLWEFPSDELILCQYTGLKDKNGKEIYEGDIVKYKQHCFNISPEKFLYKNKLIKYDDFLGRWNLYETRAGESEIEVIGNQFENPELLNK